MFSTATIDDLPAEMICKIFRHLHPKDLAVCSRINKRWHSLYAGFKVDRLVASDAFNCMEPTSSQREIEDKELCPLKMFSRIVGHPLILHLKYLVLTDSPDSPKT